MELYPVIVSESGVVNTRYPYGDARRYGVVGDGVTDDTESLEHARDSSIATRSTLYVPEGFVCYIPLGINLSQVRNIQVDGHLKGDSVENFITLGIRSQVVFPLKVMLNTVSDLTIKVQGVKNAHITILNAPRLLLWADSSSANITSLAYSSFHLGKVDTIEFDSVGTSVWINENKFFGGRITNLILKGSYAHNHNHFYSPTFEGATINIQKGSTNVLFNCRFEGKNTISFGKDAWANLIIRSWESSPGAYIRGTSNVPYTDEGKGNMVVNLKDGFHRREKFYEVSYDKPGNNLNKFIRNETGEIAVPYWTKFMTTDFIPVSSDFGIYIESDKSLWRYYIDIFDEAKNPITELLNPNDYITSPGVKWSPASKRFTQTVNSNSCHISVNGNSPIKYIKLQINTGDSSGGNLFSYIRAYLVSSYKDTGVGVIVEDDCDKATLDFIPTEGTWKKGTLAYFKEPDLHKHIGAICIEEGTPGRWELFGPLASACKKLTSPDGTEYLLSVNDAGQLVVTPDNPS